MISYEVYLTYVKLGLNPIPTEPLASEICKNIPCEICPLHTTRPCISNYFDSKTYYPTLLTQNTELAL